MNDRFDETEALLEAARITTTPEVDARVLAAAAREFPAPVFRLGSLATAAAVLLIAGGILWSVARFGQEAKPSATDIIVAQTLPRNGPSATYIYSGYGYYISRSPLDTATDGVGWDDRAGGRGSGPAGRASSGRSYGSYVYYYYGGAGSAAADGWNSTRGSFGHGTSGKARATSADLIDISRLTPANIVGGAGGGGAGGAVKILSNTRIELIGLVPGPGITAIDGPGGVYLETGGGWIRLKAPSANDEIPGIRSAQLTYPTPPTSPGGEEYDDLEANPFRDPRVEPLSTFSADVDTASYANVRRFLRGGQLPPGAAVRVEEMVNYFDYAYAEPDGGEPFSCAVDAAVCPWNPEHRIVRIGIRGKSVDVAEAPARNLVFLLDVSGSMESDDKLPLIKSAMALLVGQLDEDDRVAIVTYAGDSGIALPPTPGNDRTTILGAINRLSASGSTNAGSGIELAYELARKSFADGGLNRVILATDGDFNVGITSRGALEDLITEERKGGIFLTVLGVGTGNIKDSQMEMLADKGNGNYAYLDSILEAEKVLVREGAGTLMTIAKDVKLQVEFNPAHVGAYRLVGYENRMLAARDFADDTKDAGEIGSDHTVTALYEITPPGVFPGRPPLRYQHPPAAAEPADGFEDEVLFVKVRYKEPDGTSSLLLSFPLADPGRISVHDADPDLAFASAVAAFGLKLKGAAALGDVSWALIEEIANGAKGTDPHGDRREFVDLVRRASRLGR